MSIELSNHCIKIRGYRVSLIRILPLKDRIHAVEKGSAPMTKINRAVLSVFYEFPGPPGMMKRSLAIALSTTNFLNKGQITIVCGDQRLCAICKWLHCVIGGFRGMG